MATKLNWRGTEAERFWTRVKVLENGCWEWQGCKWNGYGCFTLAGSVKEIGAHVWSYKTCIGEIPVGLEIDHLCRNRACVNPLHLEPVTTRVNVLRGIGITAQNAAKTECKRGHPFTPENTYLWNGERECRICSKERHRGSYQRMLARTGQSPKRQPYRKAGVT